MNSILNLLLIALIVTYIIDVSSFAEDAKTAIAKWLGVKPSQVKTKPLFCSLCIVWWTSLVYLIISNNLTLLNTAIAIIIACNTNIITEIHYTVNNLLIKLLSKLN